MIDTESEPGARADAIAQSPCLRVETFGDLDQALADVEAGRVQCVCAPGQWVVWRGENGRACLELKGSK